MTVTLNWPSVLPLPSMQGYGIEDDLHVESSPMESGTERERVTSTAITSVLQVQWKFTLLEYGIFESWLVKRARGRWFNMIYLGGIGLVSCEARIQKGKASVKFQNGARATVTATISVRDRPMLSDANLQLFLEEDGQALLDAITGLHITLQQYFEGVGE